LPWGVVNADGGLNLREEPSTSARVITKVTNGLGISVLSIADGWCKVEVPIDLGMLEGYVSAEYVELIYFGWVNTSAGLNLRESASTDAEILVKLPYDTQVMILSASEGWFEVSAKVDGQTLSGFVSAEYVTTARPVN